MKQTYKVPVADIKTFKQNSAHVKTNGILPILDYILFDNGEIIKTNGHDYVVQQSNFSGAFLVDERELYSFMEYTNANDLLFTVEQIEKGKKRIAITDGVKKGGSNTDDVIHYLKRQTPSDKKTILSADTLDDIGIAAEYTDEKASDLRAKNVFVGNGAILASDGFIAFKKECSHDLPTMVLSRGICKIISGFESLVFSENEKMMFFEAANTTYGFVKSEATYFDLSPFFAMDKEKSFVINKRELLSYNNWSIARSPLKYCCPYFEISDEGLLLTMQDADYALDGSETIPAKGTMKGKFRYNAAIMNRLLSSVPDEELDFYQAKNRFYISGKSGFNSLIIEIA